MSDPYRSDASEDRSILVVAFGGKVFGVVPGTGEIAWEHVVGTLYPVVEIQIAHGRVFAATAASLYTFDYPSGEPLGEVSIPDTYEGRPTMALERERIYLASSGEVTCFGLDGTVQWVQGFAKKGLGAVALGFPGNIRQADHSG